MSNRLFGPMGQWTDDATRIQLKVAGALKPIIEDNHFFDVRDLEAVINDAVAEMFLIQRMSYKYDLPVETKPSNEVNTLPAGYGTTTGPHDGLWACIDNHQSGYDRDRQRVKELGDVGSMFKVTSVDMGSSMTYIKLSGHDQSFNSVNFRFYKDGVAHCIYSDPVYNGYL